MVELRLDNTINRIYEKYVEKNRVQPPRTHLGASEIGRECERQIWYSFRWVSKKEFGGRMLRLFETGTTAESRLTANLTDIGVEVLPFDLKTGRQFRMEMFGGHFGGSLDGILIGLVESPKTWHNLEMKTHNDKSFKSLIKDGVRKAKYEHFIQMQTYMGMSHEQALVGSPIPVLTRSFYFAVNKNTDELYGERIEYDGGVYIGIKEKARRIIFGTIPPPKLSNDKEFFQCRWCDYKDICHGTPEELVKPDKSCRTCIYSTPQSDGKWRCEKFDKNLCPEEQRAGCERHLYIPQLLPLIQQDASDNSVVYNDGNGNVTVNYEGGELVKISTKKNVGQQEEAPKTNTLSMSKPPWAID